MPKNINYELIETLYKEGLSDLTISTKVKCCSDVVIRWRKRNGLPPNKRIINRGKNIDYAKAAKLYDECMTDLEIAETLGCAPSTIKTWRENLGWASNDELSEKGVLRVEKAVCVL